MLIVFDLDGTLIDSERDLADSTNDVLIGYGAEPLPVEVVAGMVGEGARVLVRRALEARRVERPVEEAFERFLEAYDRRLVAHTRLYEGVENAIGSAAARARLAVLTNKPAGPARRILDALGLLPMFQWVIGGDGPFPRKPDPSALAHLLTESGSARARTLLVGDSAVDVATARAAGIRLCLARYGFGSRKGGIALAPGDLEVSDARELGAAIDRFIDGRSRV